MLFRETVAVYCENRAEHTDTLCGHNDEYFNVKASGTYSYHLTAKCYCEHDIVLRVSFHVTLGA
jgi:hypothetical protein